jgi:hypothetical protein
MARRETFYITPDKPAQVFALDWVPASMSVINTSNYTVYVAVGERIVPTANNNTGIVPPFSSYTAAPGGAYVFSVAVDHAGDLGPSYLYPIVVSFSEIAGDVSAPLSSSFPNTVKAQAILYSKAQTITGSGYVQWDRTQSTFQQLSFTPTQIILLKDYILDISVSIPLTSLSGSPTSINVQLIGPTTLFSFTETPRTAQTSTTINFRKIVALKTSQTLSVWLSFSPLTASGTIAADAATMIINLLS